MVREVHGITPFIFFVLLRRDFAHLSQPRGMENSHFFTVKNLFSTFFLALETAFCPPCLLLVWPSTWTWHWKGWFWSDAVGLDVCSEPSSLGSLSPTARRLHGENMMQKQQNESQFQMLLEMLGDSIFSNRINQKCFDQFGIHSEGIPDGFRLLRFQGIIYIYMCFLSVWFVVVKVWNWKSSCLMNMSLMKCIYIY